MSWRWNCRVSNTLLLLLLSFTSHRVKCDFSFELTRRFRVQFSDSFRFRIGIDLFICLTAVFSLVFAVRVHVSSGQVPNTDLRGRRFAHVIKLNLGSVGIGLDRLSSARRQLAQWSSGGGQRAGRMRLMPRSHQLDRGLAKLRFEGKVQCRFAWRKLCFLFRSFYKVFL